MKMYIPVKQEHGELEVYALDAAQPTQDMAEAILLQHIADDVSEALKEAVAVGDWVVQFDHAYRDAADHGLAWQICQGDAGAYLYSTFGYHLQVIDVEIK